MSYKIVVKQSDVAATAVVAGATTWQAFSRVWPQLLDEVRATPGIPRRSLNVMVYRDDVPNVEVGVVTEGPFETNGRVVRSHLPSGRVASTVHRGSYANLGAAHDAVRQWCQSNGHELTGVRWEIYGHWSDNPDEVQTEVCWQLGAGEL